VALAVADCRVLNRKKYDHLYLPKWYEKKTKKEKYSNNKNNLNNGEHINILNLIVISSICQKILKTSLELYRWQFDMEEMHCSISTVRAFKQPL